MSQNGRNQIHIFHRQYLFNHLECDVGVFFHDESGVGLHLLNTSNSDFNNYVRETKYSIKNLQKSELQFRPLRKKTLSCVVCEEGTFNRQTGKS